MNGEYLENQNSFSDIYTSTQNMRRFVDLTYQEKKILRKIII